MNPVENSRDSQSTTPKSPSQQKLNFTHRNHPQHTRKLFHANFNLTSSPSLKKIYKLNPTPKLSHFRLDSVDTKNLNIPVSRNSQDSKLSHQTIKKTSTYHHQTIKNTQIYQNSKKSKQTLAQSLKNVQKTRKNQGEWLKPKNFNEKPKQQITKNHYLKTQPLNNQKNNLAQYEQEPEIKQQLELNITKKTSPESLLVAQISTMKNQPRYIKDEQDFIKDDDFVQFKSSQVQLRPQTGTQKQLKSFSLLKQDLTRTSEATSSLIQFHVNSSNVKTKNYPNKKTIQSAESLASIDSLTLGKSPKNKRVSNTKLSKFSLLYSNPIKTSSRQKRYSQFKTSVIESEKERKQHKNRISLSLSHQSQGVSLFMVSSEQINSCKNTEFSELPPSHFSFTSEHSYVKKYQQLTSSPKRFIESLKELKHVGQDEEHEYFKYEKNLKKQMYYARAIDQTQGMLQNKQCGTINKEDEKKRRVSYSTFVEEIKKKQVEGKNIMIGSDKQTNCIDIANLGKDVIQLMNRDVPEPIAQVRNESSLLSNPTKVSSEENKNDNSRPQININEGGFLQSENHKNPEAISRYKNQRATERIGLYAKQMNREVIGLMFKKKTKVDKLRQKIESIKVIERELSIQNARINQSFAEKRSAHLLKFLPTE